MLFLQKIVSTQIMHWKCELKQGNIKMSLEICLLKSIFTQVHHFLVFQQLYLKLLVTCCFLDYTKIGFFNWMVFSHFTITFHFQIKNLSSRSEWTENYFLYALFPMETRKTNTCSKTTMWTLKKVWNMFKVKTEDIFSCFREYLKSEKGVNLSWVKKSWPKKSV